MSFPFRQPLSYEDQTSSDEDSDSSTPKTFQPHSSEELKQPKTFQASKKKEEPKPSVTERLGSAIKNVTESLVRPLPKHEDSGLPSEAEVESAAKAFEAKPTAEENKSGKPIVATVGDRHFILPTKDSDGNDLTPQTAIGEYRRSGRNLGEFNSPEDATRHLRSLTGETPKEETPPQAPKPSEIKKPTESNPELERLLGKASPDELSRITPSPERSSQAREMLQRMLTGTSPEMQQRLQQAGIKGVQGPDFQEIPGVTSGVNKLANLIDNPLGEGGYGRGFLAGSLQGLGKLLASGTDPRAVAPEFNYGEGGIKDVTPAKRPLAGLIEGQVAPERNPIIDVKPEDIISTTPERELSIRRGENLPPDLAAVGEEKDFNLGRAKEEPKLSTSEDELYNKAKSKFKFGEGSEASATAPKTFQPHDTSGISDNAIESKIQEAVNSPDIEQQRQAKGWQWLKENRNTYKNMSWFPEAQRLITSGASANDVATFLKSVGANRQLKPEVGTASFLGEQETGDGGKIKLYNIESGPNKGSTVSEEGLAKLGIEAPQEKASQKANFVNPFEAKEEGAIGPHKDYSNQELMQMVSSGKKPAAILEKVPDQWYFNHVKDAMDNGLDAIAHPNDPASLIVAKDPENATKLAVAIKNGDHAGAGKLLGYSDSDIKKFLNTQKSETPATFQPHEEGPQFARSEKGGLKIGQNIKRAAKELTTGYSQPLESIMMREGMQNAIDAVRHLGSDGHISSAVDYKDHIITIGDNGKGMNRAQLETVFSDLNESGKATEARATGGKGVGKASYMLGGKHFKAETVVFEGGKKIKRTIEGTPDEFSEHVPIKEETVPLNTPTGTKIETQLDEGQDHYNASQMLRDIKNYSRGIQGKLTSTRYNIEDKTGFHTGANDQLIGKANLLGNDVDVIVPKDEDNPLETRGSINIKILNNGMYQFNLWHYLGEETDHMPEHVIVNIKPTAEEGTAEYPFPTSRDALKDNIQAAVKELVNEKLVNPEKQGKKTKLIELYNSMTKFEGLQTTRKPVLYDPGNRLSASELKLFQNSPVIKTAISTFDTMIHDILTRVGNAKWSDRLEGVGIVLDPNMHGVHIPNPQTGKSTILINPFEFIANKPPEDAALENTITALHEVAHIGTESPFESAGLTHEELNDPRVGKYLQSYLEQVMTQGGLDQGHGVAFVKRLGEIYSAFGPKRTFDAADKLAQAYSGPEPGSYSPEVQKLLQIYKEREGRSPTTEDLLSGTGEKQRSSDGSKENIPEDNSGHGSGIVRSAVDKLLKNLGEAKGKVEEQGSIYKKARAERFAKFSGVKEEGSSGAAKSLSALKGEYEKVNPQSPLTNEMSATEIDSLFTAVKRAKLTVGETARAYTALFKLLNGDANPQRNELAVLDQVFGNGFGSKIVEMRGGLGAVGIKLGKAANTMKSMMNSVNMGAPLLHGLPLIHRPEFRDAAVEMIKYMGNTEYYNAAMKAIENHPNYQLYRESGGFIAKPEGLTQTEEDFANSYIGKIPRGTGIPQMVAFSKRGYTGFLNKLRFDTFNNLIRNANDMGEKPYEMTRSEGENGKMTTTRTPNKLARDLARYVNTSTDRGNMGRLEKIAPELNYVLWSPRRIAARFAQLNPKYYADLDPFARKQALKSLLAMAAAGTGMVTLGVLAGGKTSLDPSDPDFMKVRFGDHVLNPLGPTQSIIVAASKMIKELDRMGEGRKPKFGEQNIPEIGVNFLRNRESPAARLADSIASARYFTGEGKPGDMSTVSPPEQGGFVDRFGKKQYISAEVRKSFTPIFVQDVQELLKTDQSFAQSIGLGASSFVGISEQNIPEHQKAQTGGIRRLGAQRLRP